MEHLCLSTGKNDKNKNENEFEWLSLGDAFSNQSNDNLVVTEMIPREKCISKPTISF